MEHFVNCHGEWSLIMIAIGSWAWIPVFFNMWRKNDEAE